MCSRPSVLLREREREKWLHLGNIFPIIKRMAAFTYFTIENSGVKYMEAEIRRTLLSLSSAPCVFCSGSESGLWKLHLYISGVDHQNRPGCWDQVRHILTVCMCHKVTWRRSPYLSVSVCVQTNWAESRRNSDWRVGDLPPRVHTSQDALHVPVPQSVPHRHQQSYPHRSWWDKSTCY